MQIEETDDVSKKRLIPVFVGEMPNGERITLYQWALEFYLERPDGSILALAPGTTIDRTIDLDGLTHLQILSSDWALEATGTKAQLIAADARYV